MRPADVDASDPTSPPRRHGVRPTGSGCCRTQPADSRPSTSSDSSSPLRLDFGFGTADVCMVCGPLLRDVEIWYRPAAGTVRESIPSVRGGIIGELTISVVGTGAERRLGRNLNCQVGGFDTWGSRERRRARARSTDATREVSIAVERPLSPKTSRAPSGGKVLTTSGGSGGHRVADADGVLEHHHITARGLLS